MINYNLYDLNVDDEIFHHTCTQEFSNNTKVNTSYIDTFENHLIDFSKSSNVKLEGINNYISLNDSSNEGYYITRHIYPYTKGQTINNFYMFSNYSVKTDKFGDVKPKIQFFIVTNKNEEFEINHNFNMPLILLNGVESFRIKCKLTPSSDNISPKVFGHCCFFNDKTIYDFNKTNI